MLLLFGYLLCLFKPIISTLALQENSGLELANQSMGYIGYKHKL